LSLRTWKSGENVVSMCSPQAQSTAAFLQWTWVCWSYKI